MDTNREDIFWLKLQEYSEGKLSGEEAQEMKAWVANNTDAQITLAGFEQLAAEIPNPAEREVYYTQQSEKIIEQNQFVRKSSFPKWMAVAASLVIIGIAAFFLQRDTSADSLLQVYISDSYPAPTTIRGEDGYPEWAEKYKAGDFAEASELLESLPKPTERELFYLGVCQLQTQNYDKAISTLSKEDLTYSLFSEQSQWHLALLYLQTKQKQKAKELLLEIKKTEGYKHKEASELLESLN